MGKDNVRGKALGVTKDKVADKCGLSKEGNIRGSIKSNIRSKITMTMIDMNKNSCPTHEEL